MPAPKKSANFWRSNVPGLASSVISASGTSGTRARTAGEQPIDGRGGEEAGRAAADEHGADLAAPDRRQRGLEIGEQRIDVRVFGNRAARLVRVEVAVRALAHAPRQVHVQRQRRQHGEARTGEARHGHRRRSRRQSRPDLRFLDALDERAHRPAAMRHRVLLRERHFGAGQSGRQVDEVRVVAEAAVPARRVDDRARAMRLRRSSVPGRRRGAPAPARSSSARAGRPHPAARRRASRCCARRTWAPPRSAPTARPARRRARPRTRPNRRRARAASRARSRAAPSRARSRRTSRAALPPRECRGRPAR